MVSVPGAGLVGDESLQQQAETRGRVRDTHSAWRVGDETSRLLIDVTAGRPVAYERPLTSKQLGLARRHGLLGLLAHAPDQHLRDPAVLVYLLAAARQREMRSHLRKVLTDLSEAGVRVAVVKGPYLALSYRNPSLRTYNDLDVLVPREDLERALEVLAANPAVSFIPPKRPRADKRDIPFHGHSGSHFTLDLHWDLFSYSQLRGCASRATRWAWDRAVEDADHELGPLWHLPMDARLGFLCTHAILDHRYRLILFRDLAEMAAGLQLEWDEIVSFAGRWGLRSVTYLAWLMAAHLVEAPVPAEALAQLRPSNLPTRFLEVMLPRTDVVHFDGHRPHPVNLATVLLHDELSQRLVLAARAPLAVPGWRRRVGFPPAAGGKVTIVVTSNRRRGAEVFGERLREGLTAFGWRASLVALAGGKMGGSTVDAQPLSDRSVDRLGRLDRGVVLALRRHIRATRPRIVIANGSATLQYSLAATFALRHRPAVVYMSIGEPRYWMRGLRRRLAHRLLLARVDLILAVSRETARQLTEELGVAPERIRVAHTGVPGQFLEIEPDRADRHAELRLLFLGNLSAEKGPLLAVELLDRLSVPARLRLVGSGPMMDRIRSEIERLDLADRVEVTGAVADVRPHMAWADLLVLTSKSEGLPGAVLEAAAAGVPAVAFDVGGTGETIVDGRTGRLIAPGDLPGMARAIEELADPQVRAAAGLAAREMVREAFTLETSVSRYHQLLLELLSQVAVAARAGM